MKKTSHLVIKTILFAVLILFLHSISNISGYTINIKRFDAVPEDTTQQFEEAKQALRNELSDYEFLNWDRFEKAELYQGYIFYRFRQDRTPACYVASSNSIFISNYFYSMAKEPRYITLTHELVHSLCMAEADQDDIIFEGLTERIAESVASANPSSMDIQGGVSVSFYPYSCHVVSLLEKRYDKAELLRMLVEGTADDHLQVLMTPYDYRELSSIILKLDTGQDCSQEETGLYTEACYNLASKIKSELMAQ